MVVMAEGWCAPRARGASPGRPCLIWSPCVGWEGGPALCCQTLQGMKGTRAGRELCTCSLRGTPALQGGDCKDILGCRGHWDIFMHSREPALQTRGGDCFPSILGGPWVSQSFRKQRGFGLFSLVTKEIPHLVESGSLRRP